MEVLYKIRKSRCIVCERRERRVYTTKEHVKGSSQVSCTSTPSALIIPPPLSRVRYGPAPYIGSIVIASVMRLHHRQNVPNLTSCVCGGEATVCPRASLRLGPWVSLPSFVPFSFDGSARYLLVHRAALSDILVRSCVCM